MIEARKNRFIEAIFARLNTAMIRRHFFRLHLAGEEHVAGLDRSIPIIFFGNHSCWWDGLIEFHLSRERFGCDAYLMMEERQMKRYSFFKWIGAFSVDRESPRGAVRSIRYASEMLRTPNRALWIYPQGVMQSNDVRPIRFYRGILRVAEPFAKVQFVPVAHRYEFLGEQRPEAFVKIGTPVIVEQSRYGLCVVDGLQQALTSLLNGLRDDLARGQLNGYTPILSGSSSVNARYDQLLRQREHSR